MDEDSEAQKDEMMAIESILDPHTFHVMEKAQSNDKPISGLLKIDFHFPSLGFTITAITRKEDKSVQKLTHKFTHMPPLQLHFILPKDYPSKSKPIFTLSSTWMDRTLLSRLCSKLDKIWDEEKGNAVIFSWYTFLQDSLTFLGLEDYDVTWVHAPSHRNKKLKSLTKFPLDPRAVFERMPDQILDYLITFNDEESERIFRLNFHNCAICISDKSGKYCQRFSCEHIFCTECISEYFRGLITEGNLDAVKCPAFKCDIIPTPTKVKEIVGEELYERYDRLLLQRTLENMSDVITCPILNCQCAVLSDPNDKLAKCPKCHFNFCSCCKSVFHGVEPCRFKSDERKQVYEKYTSGDADAKMRLEKTYGKKQLDLLVQTVLSEKWVSSKSKPCPHCSVPIDKFEGCNKVTCFKCNTYFCWICSTQLENGNPYLHFNDPSSKCYNNLFLNADDDEDEGDEDDEDWNQDLSDDSHAWSTDEDDELEQ